uniref:Gustatory receptor 28b isoform X2 n=1 Tax=Diabrotica virgifera virgifera TaxID=50390 RepID=A0A6P7FWK4_DIAVI
MDVIKALMNLINVIALINKCDKIEKNTQEFVVTCHLLQENMQQSSVRDELVYLANYAEKISPKCSAAGFFNVNRFTIGTLFSTVTTYLIVCIQFNMSETKKAAAT